MVRSPERQAEAETQTLIPSSCSAPPRRVAIGIAPLGIVSIGIVPMGVVSIGVVPMGVVSLGCLLYTSPSPRDGLLSRMPSSA